MKLTILSLGFACLLMQSKLTAQLSLPRHTSHSQQRAESLIESGLPLGYDALKVLAPTTWASPEQQRHLNALASIRGQQLDIEEYTQQLLQQYPDLKGKERIKLLLGVYALELKDQSQGEKFLAEVDPQGLYQYEAEQLQCLLGYLALQAQSHQKTSEAITRLRPIAQQGKTLWGERARLYLAIATWQQQGIKQANAILEQGQWSAELLPQVEYLGTLMETSQASPQRIISAVKQLTARYPQYAQDSRLAGLMGQAYYLQGAHDKAIQTLKSILHPTPQEAYALGSALYLQGKPHDALPYLQTASQLGQSENPTLVQLGANAEYALGNIYRSAGKLTEARLAFRSASTLSNASPQLKEFALYQLLELGFGAGQDSFGELARQTETFLTQYPNSKHAPRILELLGSYLASSQDYEASLRLLDRLKNQGKQLAPLKQDILLRLAYQRGTQSEKYLPTLNEAIALGKQSPAYAVALITRAKHTLTTQAEQAEQDLRTALGIEQLSPEHHLSANYLLGYMLYNQKRYAEAKPRLEAITQSQASTEQKGDALLRLADIASLSNPALASKYYREASELTPAGSLEALTRLSYIQGQRGLYQEQLATIAEIERKHAQSDLSMPLYQKAKALAQLGQTEQAIQVYSSIEQLYHGQSIAPKAMLEVALLRSNQDKDAEAIALYKRLIATYPDSPEARTALQDLRSLHAENNTLDSYAQYVASLPKHLTLEGDAPEHLAYLALESRVARGVDVTQELERFIQQYPTANDRPKAEQLLKKLYQGQALALEESEKFAEALALYAKLYTLSSSSPDEQLSAGYKQALMAYHLADYASTLSITKTLLKRNELRQEHRLKLALLEGKAHEGNKALKSAIASYSTISKQSQTAQGAEAAIRQAELYLSLGQLSQAKQLMTDFTASGTSQQYWLARGFILLSDCYAQEGDHYLAQQYLQSLKENYQGQETDIKEMIKQRLKN